MISFSTTLSSKNQITLPVEVLQALGWHSGQRFTIVIGDNSLIIQSFEDILNDIGDIVANYKLPKIDLEKAIAQTHRTANDQKYQYEN